MPNEIGAKCLKKASSLGPGCPEVCFWLDCLHHHNPSLLAGNKHKTLVVLRQSETTDIIGATRIQVEQVPYN